MKIEILYDDKIWKCVVSNEIIDWDVDLESLMIRIASKASEIAEKINM